MIYHQCEIGLCEIAEVIEDRYSDVTIPIKQEYLRNIEIAVLLNNFATYRPQQRYTHNFILLCLHKRYLHANGCKSIESYI